MEAVKQLCKIRPRKDHCRVDLISDVLPFGRLWYDTPDHAIGYAMHYSRPDNAVIRVYVKTGKVIRFVSTGCRLRLAMCASIMSGRNKCGENDNSHALASSSSRIMRMISPRSGYVRS